MVSRQGLRRRSVPAAVRSREKLLPGRDDHASPPENTARQLHRPPARSTSASRSPPRRATPVDARRRAPVRRTRHPTGGVPRRGRWRAPRRARAGAGAGIARRGGANCAGRAPAANASGRDGLLHAEPADTGTAQLDDVRARSQAGGDVAGERPDVGPARAARRRAWRRGVPTPPGRGDPRGPGARPAGRAARPGQLVRTPAVHVDGGVRGRCLEDVAAERGQRRLDGRPLGNGSLGHHRAFGIEGVGADAEADAGEVILVEGFRERGEPGVTAAEHHEQAAREPVERAGVADPPRAERALHAPTAPGRRSAPDGLSRSTMPSVKARCPSASG